MGQVPEVIHNHPDPRPLHTQPTQSNPNQGIKPKPQKTQKHPRIIAESTERPSKEVTKTTENPAEAHSEQQTETHSHKGENKNSQ